MIRIAYFCWTMFLLLTVVPGQAQELFRVLAFKGTGTYTNAGKDAKIVTGAKLAQNSVIKLGPDSYVALVHKTGKSKELKAAGTYKAADIDKEMNSGAKSATEKYAEYVMTELTKTADAGNRGDKMTVTGSVERGAEDAALKVLSPPTADVVKDKSITLAWVKPEQHNTFKVQVLNMYEDTLLSKTVTGTSMVLDLSAEKFDDTEALIWNVMAADDASIKSSNSALKFVDEQKAASIQKELKELQKELTEVSPVNSLILGAFYEQNNLLLNALTEYKKAADLAPKGVTEFESVYRNFLLRNGM